MKASEIMTYPVITVTPETSIAEAARLMLQHRISGLPVVDAKSAVIGIITEGDLLRRGETGSAPHHPWWLQLLLGPGRLAKEYTLAHARKVGEAMTGDVVSVTPKTDLRDIVQLMNKRRIKRVPVIEDRKLAGIVSRANLVRALVKALVKKPARPLSDHEIRTAILDATTAEPWGPRFAIDVEVKDGFVDIYGTITDEGERIALQVLAENVPGVKGVRDHLVWVEPASGMVIGPE
jgi:CBS-domain-containing membrane protein